uniref:olfactory receptor 14C36-like n=1 Tax=Agelaius phoeniceus TaxID=39638 RepID=UPI0023ED271B|nr:olfactory receptor 14C36-like [Agelaius phoeniceus]
MEDTGCGVAFASAAPRAAAILAGAVPKVHVEGKAHRTSGEGSQTNAAASDMGSEHAAAAGLQPATVGRRRRRAVMTPKLEVGTRRSAWIMAQTGVPAGGGLHAPAGGVDKASEEEERGSGTDPRDETLETERKGDSDISSGEAGGVPEGALPSINKETPLQRYHWVVLPQGLKNSLTICQWYVARALSPARKKFPKISYSGCAAQVFLFAFFISAEVSLLTIMCYDRYVSICKPLHYGTLLGSRACAHMAAAAWASAFLNALLHTANTFSLPLCHGNALGQFFCEIPHILKLSCSHSTFRKIWISLLGVCLGFGCFVFIVFSYVQIFRAVLRIPCEQGRHKAFSTCLPHLAVVSLFVSTGIFSYLKPPSISSPSLDLTLSVLYSVVPPALNPLIYSLRNQELKAAVCKMMTGRFQKH